MSDQYEKLLQEALALSPDERSMLVEDLHASLRTPEEQAIAEEWEAEAARRWEEIERGEVETIPHDEVMARARAALHATRVASRR